MNYGKLVMMCAGIAGVIGVSTLAQAQAQGLAWKLRGGFAGVSMSSPTQVPRQVGAVIPVKINMSGENYDDLAIGSTLTQTKGLGPNPAYTCSGQVMTNSMMFGPEQTNKLGAKNSVTVTNGTIENLRITSCRSVRMNDAPGTHNGLAYVAMSFDVKITAKANETAGAGTATITYDTNPRGGAPATTIIGGIK